MSFFDSLFGSNGGQTPEEAAANIDRLQQEATALQNEKLASGTISQTEYNQNIAAIQGDSFTDPGAAASQSFFDSLNPFYRDPNASPSGLSAFFKDLLTLAAIGLAIWLFVKLGGIKQIKKFVE